jgi:hypothetical protein
MTSDDAPDRAMAGEVQVAVPYNWSVFEVMLLCASDALKAPVTIISPVFDRVPAVHWIASMVREPAPVREPPLMFRFVTLYDPVCKVKVPRFVSVLTFVVVEEPEKVRVPLASFNTVVTRDEAPICNVLLL